MAWYSDWYAQASDAVGSTVEAGQEWVSGLFKTPTPDTAGGINSDDTPSSPGSPTAEILRDTGLWRGEPTTDITIPPAIQKAPAQSSILGDIMQLPGQAVEQVKILVGGIADTFGLTSRPGAQTVTGTVRQGVTKAIESIPVLGGFLQTTLSKIIVVLVLAVLGLFIVNRFLGRRGL
jgi:hypothetical protein